MSDQSEDPAAEDAHTTSTVAEAEQSNPNKTESDNVGSDTAGDPYVGSFGNGGYDVSHYDVALSWQPASSMLDGTTTVTATATQTLERFNLDLMEFEVRRVTVDGENAAFVHEVPELSITPIEPIAAGEELTVVIEYVGTPSEVEGGGVEVPIPSGWHTREGYAYVAGEPLSAPTFHPVNDHPSDKAAFTYRLTVPSDDVAAASGTLESKTTNGETTTWVYDQPHPQAS